MCVCVCVCVCMCVCARALGNKWMYNFYCLFYVVACNCHYFCFCMRLRVFFIGRAITKLIYYYHRIQSKSTYRRKK